MKKANLAERPETIGEPWRPLLVVPRGVEHRPATEEEASVLLFEPAGVRNKDNVEQPTLAARSPSTDPAG